MSRARQHRPRRHDGSIYGVKSPPGLCLKGRVPSGQSQSGCRAVTGGVKAVGGAVTGGWECDGGLVLGYGNAFRVESVQWGGGRGVPPPLSSDSLVAPDFSPTIDGRLQLCMLREGAGGGTSYWAPRTRKRHQQEYRPQRPTESSDPTQHAKGRTGDRPGPRKGATTRRNVTQGARAPGLCLEVVTYPTPLGLRPRHTPTASFRHQPLSNRFVLARLFVAAPCPIV